MRLYAGTNGSKVFKLSDLAEVSFEKVVENYKFFGKKI